MSSLHIDAPISLTKKILIKEMNEDWQKEWFTSNNGQWTAQIFPTIKTRKRAGQLDLHFVVTQFLSGHSKFGQYLHRMGCRRDPYCRCGHEQTP